MQSNPIRRSQAGDEQAFAALFHEYKNLVYKTAYLMLDDAGEAEDALQEVFLQVHRSLATFQPSKGAFSTWLYRITVNHCLNRRRKRCLPILSLELLTRRSRTELPSILENQTAEDVTVQQALGRLSEKLRTVMIMRYYWQLSHAEMSQVLDVPVGTVKSRLSLAVKTIREELEAATKGAQVPSTFCPQEGAK